MKKFINGCSVYFGVAPSPRLKLLILFLPLLLLMGSAQGAVIHGVVYSWETFEPVKKVIITINTTPEQREVSEDGSYSFTVPDGVYVIKAYYYRQQSLILYGEEMVSVKGEGDYILDLVIFPPLADIQFLEDPNTIDFALEDSTGYKIQWILGGVAILIGAAVFLVLKIYGLKRHSKSTGRDIPLQLPEDLVEVLKIIEKEGGRITQKDLRRKLGFSEAKVSLLIADLERRNLVEKVKKGRGNIIFLKKSSFEEKNNHL